MDICKWNHHPMLRLFTLEHAEPHQNSSGGGLQKEDQQHCREVVERSEAGTVQR